MKMIQHLKASSRNKVASHGSSIFPLLLLFTSALLLLTASVSRAQKTKSEAECTEPEEFWGCQSPTRGCQRLCENRRLKPVHTQCELSCEKACVCEAGFLRNGTNGGCIFPAECPQTEELKAAEKEEESLRKQNRVAKRVADGDGADQTEWL